MKKVVKPEKYPKILKWRIFKVDININLIFAKNQA